MCLINLQKACNLKAKCLKLFKDSILELQIDTIKEEQLTSCNDFCKLYSKNETIKISKIDGEQLTNCNESCNIYSQYETTKINETEAGDQFNGETPELNEHLSEKITNKKTNKTSFCNQCDISFESKRSFNQHMQKHKFKICSICGTSIRSDNF